MSKKGLFKIVFYSIKTYIEDILNPTIGLISTMPRMKMTSDSSEQKKPEKTASAETPKKEDAFEDAKDKKE